MSEVFSGKSVSPFLESPYPSHRSYAQEAASSFIGNIGPHFPERVKTGFFGETPSSSSSMADPQKRGIYDTQSTRVSDEYQRRQPLSQRTSREQLPPLSSIFHTSHTAALPVRTPYQERSPNFAAVSPKTNSRPVTLAGEDRSYSDASSYEHRNYIPPANFPYSFDGRPERPSISQTPRTLSTGSITGGGGGPSQPIEPQYNINDVGRIQLAPGVRWSPRASEPSSSDYFRRSSQSHNSHNKRYSDVRHQPPLAPPASRDSKLAFGEKHYNTSPPLTQYQIASSITSLPEPSCSTKDSLGPKIWTGAHFLPRFVKQQEVPGEGLCYFYDDGSHCKTVIDGEAVNAHWGVTKAGKPRKRLAIACITCREKKIKCDPDYPKCVQCEKFGRLCKFKNAPRGTNHESSETTSPTETEDFMDRDSNFGSTSQRSDADARRIEKEETENNHTKRRKNTLTAFTPVKTENEGNDGFRHLSSASESSIYHDTLMNTWYTDPYETHATLSDQLMAAYFIHINSGLYCMFPEEAFMSWLRNPTKKKSLDDHMLIYAMLALGTAFSGSIENRERGREFARVSRYAIEHRSFSLQLVHSRLILSLYFLAMADEDTAWDLSGGAMCAASALKLNVEDDEIGALKVDGFPYDLDRHGYAECRRRTFWSLYIMDRFNGSFFGYVRVINSEDVYLRLPNDLYSFEKQVENTNPYFDISASFITLTQTSKLGSMAYLLMISSIWGDVMANIYRTSSRPDQMPPISKTAYTNFHNNITERLDSWDASLPPTLQYSTANLDRSIHERGFGTFVTMHALYHTIEIKLNRYHRAADVSPPQMERNVRTAHTSARKLLALADTLTNAMAIRPHLGEMTAAKCEFSNPFIGYAIVNAVDLLTAKGRRIEAPNLLQTFDGARAVLRQLENFWHSTRTASRLMERRIEELEEMIGWSEQRRRSEAWAVEADATSRGFWEMEESIEKGFAKGLDGVYKAPWNIWVAATEGCKTERYIVRTD